MSQQVAGVAGKSPAISLAVTEEVRKLAIAKSRIRHSQLQNQLLQCDPAFVARLHGAPSEARTAFDGMIASGGDFTDMVEHTRQLCDLMILGCSPTRLFELAPLSALPAPTRCALANLFHSLYLESTAIEHTRAEALAALRTFEVGLNEFQRLWSRDPPAPADAISSKFAALQELGARLDAVLGRIPEGIALP